GLGAIFSRRGQRVKPVFEEREFIPRRGSRHRRPCWRRFGDAAVKVRCALGLREAVWLGFRLFRYNTVVCVTFGSGRKAEETAQRGALARRRKVRRGQWVTS